MGKYSTYTKKQQAPRNRDVHPVMRGIGCLLIVLVPILSYLASILIVNYGASRGWPIPREWFGPLTVHPLLWKIQGLQSVLQFLQTQNNLEANLVFAAVIAIVAGGFLTILYGYIYKIFGPPAYGPQDAPPIRKKLKPYKR